MLPHTERMVRRLIAEFNYLGAKVSVSVGAPFNLKGFGRETFDQLFFVVF